MLKKRYVSDGKVCEVTFVLPSEFQAASAVLVGDFNNWDKDALPMKKAKNGAWKAKVKLEADRGNQAKSEMLADEYTGNVSGSAEESVKLGLAFQELNDPKMDEYALGCYRQALHLAPNSARINRQIGFYYLSKNQDTLAKEYLVRSFQLDSNQPDVAGALGRLGVAVEIPRKKQKAKKIDKIVDRSDKTRQTPP